MTDARLVVTDVVKTFGWTKVLKGVNLSVEEGEYVALMGHNGAGKTTLLRMVAGLAVPTSGSVTLAGVDLRRAGPGLRRMLGFVSHESLLYPDLTGRENLDFHARLFGVEDPQRVIEIQSELLDLDPILDRPAGVLSRGNRQRLTLARSLLYGPRVLLLDEPFTGLDEQSAVRLLSILDTLVESGRTVIMTTHDKATAHSGPQRLIFIDEGVVSLDEPIKRLTLPSGLPVAPTPTLSPPPAYSTINAVEVPDPVDAAFTQLAAQASETSKEFISPKLVTPPGRLKSAWMIAKKDLKVEMRTRDVLGSAGLFALSVLITSSFTMPQGDARSSGIATGVLWISLLFAVLLGVGRSMARETADRGIEGLLLSPAPRESVFLGKLLGSMVLISIVGAVIVPMFIAMMTQDGQGASFPALIGTVLLGLLGLVTVATLFSGIAVGSRLGESMLPLIVMPVVIPLMVGAVELTRMALGFNGPSTSVYQWLGILGGFDLMVLIVAIVTFTFVIEE